MSEGVSGSRRDLQLPCKLEPQAFVSHLIPMLGTEFESSVPLPAAISLAFSQSFFLNTVFKTKTSTDTVRNKSLKQGDEAGGLERWLSG